MTIYQPYTVTLLPNVTELWQRGDGSHKKGSVSFANSGKIFKRAQKKRWREFPTKYTYYVCMYHDIKRTRNIPQKITEKTEKNLTKKKSKQGEDKKENKSFPSWAWFCFVCALFHNAMGAWVGGVGCGWLPLSACTSHLSPGHPSAPSISTMSAWTDHFVWHYCHSITLMTRQ